MRKVMIWAAGVLFCAVAQAEDFCDPFYGICSDPSLEPERQTDDEVCDPFIFDCEGLDGDANGTTCDPFTEACPDGSTTGLECDPEIEVCATDNGFVAKERYEIIDLILIVFNIVLQVLALLIPVLFGADAVDMELAWNISIYGYGIMVFIFIGFMISSGFTSQQWLKDLTVIVIEHVLSNFAPIAIIITVIYAFLNASTQEGAGTVWTGGVIYFLLAGGINFLMMGWSYGAIRYVDKSWNRLPGPYILPSWLHLLGVGTWPDGEPPQQSTQEA